VQKHTKTIVGFLGTVDTRICNYMRQLPAKRSYRQVFETDCIDNLLTEASATVQSTLI